MQRICTSGSGKNTCGRGYRWIPYVVSFVKRGTTPLVNARGFFFFRDSGVWGSREHERLRTGGVHEARQGMRESHDFKEQRQLGGSRDTRPGLRSALVPGARVHPASLGPAAHVRGSGVPGQRAGLGIRLGRIPAPPQPAPLPHSARTLNLTAATRACLGGPLRGTFQGQHRVSLPLPGPEEAVPSYCLRNAGSF